MTTPSLPRAESLKPYESLIEMRVVYHNLAREYGNTLGDPPAALLNAAEKFVSRGCETGTLLDDPDERWDAQNMVNFWAKILYRYSGAPGDERPMATLAPFGSLEAAPAKLSDVPFQAPPMRPDVYLGRESFLSDLKQQLLTGRNIALYSSPGMGKTLIATKLAHDAQVREKYPDGVLWAKLGDHPDLSSILCTWGQALKISNEMDWYVDLDRERAAKLIRQFLQRRRMLLVIDDAWQSDVVKALKLGGPNCVHIVTTYLMSVALDFDPQGAVTVPGLDESDGLTLLKSRAPRAVAGKEEEARELVKKLGDSPFALSLIANYYASEDSGRSSLDLKELYERVVEEKQAIGAERAAPLYKRDEMQTPSSLLAAISWCFEHLSDRERHVLDAFSSFPPKPNSFSDAAARYVAAEGNEGIEMMINKGLLERAAPDRYSLHRSVSDFLKRRTHARTDNTPEQRMASFFVNFVKDPATELHELDQEEKNIFAALDTAYEHGMWELVVEGTVAIFGYLDRRGLYPLANKHLLRARECAEKLNNDKSLASILLKMGEINERQSEYAEAGEHLKASLDIARRVDDHDITARALKSLGVVNMALANYEKAQDYLNEALVLAQQNENASVACDIETRLGWLGRALGRFEESRARTEHALALATESNQIAELKLSLGVLDFFEEKYEQAKAHDEEGLHYAEEAQDKRLQCALNQALGGVQIELENFEAAETHLMKSLHLAVDIGQRWYTSVIWKEIGELKLKQKYANSAADAFKKALDLAREVNSPELMGLAIYGLARVAAIQKNNAEARLQGQNCLNIFHWMGYYKKDEVQKWIDSLPVSATATGSTLRAE